MTYCIDIILCIDCARSMKPFLDEVKKRALSFSTDLLMALAEKDKKVEELRVKVISFRNLSVDGDMALTESPFYVLPSENDDFVAYVRSISAFGGGQLASASGLEALALAIRAGWTHKGDRRRHFICIYTDKEGSPLEHSRQVLKYPRDMPSTFDELTNWWHAMSRPSKRLALYAPDAYPWTDISNYWDNVLHYSSQAGQGLEEVDYKTIISAMTSSIRLQ